MNNGSAAHKSRRWRSFLVLICALLALTTVVPSEPAGAFRSQPTADQPVYLPLVFGGAAVALAQFDPNVNGFGFENYGGDNGYTNLTAVEVRRLFGDKACANIANDGSCTLTPAAEQWLQEQNKGMNGGHCEGMAVLSQLLYGRTLSASDFGAAQTIDLPIANNTKLQREIAYWFITQATRPANEALVKGTPNDIVAALRQSYASGKPAEFAIGFYKRDKSGGHAVTPIGVEDRANGIVAILLYDNNYPRLTREILVDTAANTWRYSGSTNPAVPADDYEGDASTQTLELAPIAPRIPQQTCPFCEPASAAIATDPVTRYNEFYLDGDADLLITEDVGGRSIGFVNGQPVNTLPGAQARSRKYLTPVWENAGEPVYSIPTSTDVTVTIDGRRLSRTSNSAVTMIGPGYSLEVNDIPLGAGQVDTLNVNTNGTQLRYTSASGETPDLVLGFETAAADYALAVKGFDLAANGSVTLDVDEANGTVRLRAATSQSVAFALELERIGTNGTAVFGTGTDVTIGGSDVLIIKYGAWQANGQTLEVQIDRGGDGTIDETQQLVDASDTFDE